MTGEPTRLKNGKGRDCDRQTLPISYAAASTAAVEVTAVQKDQVIHDLVTAVRFAALENA